MKKLLLCLLIGLPGLLAAQKNDLDKALDGMVQAEKNFARSSYDKGTREAFLGALADNSIVFKPGPVSGIPFWKSAGEGKGWLDWEPSYAEIAASGDFGFTYGPWKYRKTREDEKAVAFGYFATVWKRQASGQWKVMTDIGNFNEEPVGIPEKLVLGDTKNKKAFSSFDAGSELQKLQQIDASGLTDSRPIANNGSWFLRLEKLPYTDGGAALSEEMKAMTQWSPMGGEIAASGDMAYTYGAYECVKNGNPEKGHYLRIWKRQPGTAWAIAVDVWNPVPPEQAGN